jgi:hypothetical protein
MDPKTLRGIRLAASSLTIIANKLAAAGTKGRHKKTAYLSVSRF